MDLLTVCYSELCQMLQNITPNVAKYHTGVHIEMVTATWHSLSHVSYLLAVYFNYSMISCDIDRISITVLQWCCAVKLRL